MEIVEVISYSLDLDRNILEVSFRTINDDEDSIRVDNIDYNVVSEYGYELETESFDFFNFEEEETDNQSQDVELDRDSLVSFLNEYYTVNQNNLPKPEFL